MRARQPKVKLSAYLIDDCNFDISPPTFNADKGSYAFDAQMYKLVYVNSETGHILTVYLEEAFHLSKPSLTIIIPQTGLLSHTLFLSLSLSLSLNIFKHFCLQTTLEKESTEAAAHISISKLK